MNLDIKDNIDFYKSFQLRKNYRKEIEQIKFDFNYNFTQKRISFDNFKIDNKSNSKIEDFVERFNSNRKLFNKITFKNFVNDFLKFILDKSFFLDQLLNCNLFSLINPDLRASYFNVVLFLSAFFAIFAALS